MSSILDIDSSVAACARYHYDAHDGQHEDTGTDGQGHHGKTSHAIDGIQDTDHGGGR